ncbi:MAG TPA: tetratricopeptide repeat protein [Pyrinomonadaceae bacterium]|nr:tetratricopeptide repeat protein [Pyrinomonadaceae bacterium]
MKRFLPVAVILILFGAHISSAQTQASSQAHRNSGNQASNSTKPKPSRSRAKPANSSSGAAASSGANQSPSTANDTQQSSSTADAPAPQASAASANAAAATDFFNRGQEHYRAHRFQQAVAAYKKALNLRPNDAQTHYELGMAYYSLNLYTDAASEYRQAIKLNPKSADAHFRLGWMNYVLGKKRAATEEYERLKTLDPAMAQKLYRIINEQTGSATAEHTNAPSQSNASPQTSATSQQLTQTPADQTAAAAQPEPTVTTVLRPPSDSAPAPTSSPANSSPANNSTTTPSDGTVSSTPPSTPAPSSTTANNSSNSANPTTANPTAASAASAPSETSSPAATEADALVADAPPTTIYRVGVGDVLDVRVANSPNSRSTLYTVLDGGVLDFPLAGGPIKIAGMTTGQVSVKLAGELRRRNVQESTQILVSVREFSSHTILVSGLVSYPGSRVLRREAVPLYVVLAEAQPRPDAGRVLIMRDGAQVSSVDLNDPTATSVLVEPGDVITVSARQQQFYYIGGRVNSPGQKLFQPGITLTQAILAAGGLTRSGENVVEVAREGADGRLTTTHYVLRDIKTGRIQDPHLQPGDRVEVGH